MIHVNVISHENSMHVQFLKKERKEKKVDDEKSVKILLACLLAYLFIYLLVDVG